MLNWIWLGLIVIALAVATGRDVSELSSDRFRNGKPIAATITSVRQIAPDRYISEVSISRADLFKFYDSADVEPLKTDSLRLSIESPAKGAASIQLASPQPQLGIWGDMAEAQGDKSKLVGSVEMKPGVMYFLPEPVRFRILAKVANEGLLKMADTAVTIALGLIGVMALWLGIMKIAEAAGLVTLLAKMAKPLMIRLFPDVPPEHPAMGAMLSNMAANMLGLSNAATPLGLKAMEELNKLNKHAGTATDAMCMFLTINTSAITIIPATVIAIRVSLGSHSPSDIIVPTFIATVVALTCGVFFNRFIQRFFPVKAND